MSTNADARRGECNVGALDLDARLQLKFSKQMIVCLE
jgi:hypothetical protein